MISKKLVLTFAILMILFLSWMWPLTYDEAWNFLNIARHGFFYPMFHYGATGNNHVLFTELQAFLPHPLVFAHPFILRFWNVTAVLLCLICLARLIDDPYTLFALIFCCPLLVLYLVVARGYLLGAVLLLWSIELRSRLAASSNPQRKLGFLSDLLMALSGYTLVTYGFQFPGIFVFDCFTRGLKRALKSAGIIFVITIVLYSPILRNILAQRNKLSSFSTPMSFTNGILERSTWLGSHLSLALSLLWIAAGLVYLSTTVADARKRRAKLKLPQIQIGYYLSAAVSFIVVVELANWVKFNPPPFPRNALGVPFFLWVSFSIFVLSALTNARWKKGLQLLILANLILGLWKIVGALPHNLGRMPYAQILAPTPINRALIERLPTGTKIHCEANAEPVCRIHRWLLYEHGMEYVKTEPASASTLAKCIYGKVAPGQNYNVWIREPGQDHWNRGCF